MKKLKLVLALLAITSAISAFAFSKVQSNEELTEYVWFEITDHKECDDLVLTMYPAIDPDTRPDELPAELNPNGCPIVGTVCCAKGYAASDLVIENINGFNYWVPGPLATPVVIYKFENE